MPSHSPDLNQFAWDAPRLGEALTMLARQARLVAHPDAASIPSIAACDTANHDLLSQWLNLVADELGIEVEPVESTYADVERLIHGVAPAILYLPQPTATTPRFLALLTSNATRVILLAPDFSTHRVSPHVISRALCAPLETPRRATLDAILDRAGIAPAERARVGAALIAEQLSGARLAGGWLVRLSPSASIWQHALHARLVQPLLATIGADLIRQVMLLAAWLIIGRGVFGAHFEPAWLWAWALLVLSGIPFQLQMTHAQGQLATGLSGIFKTRLLYGTLKLEPDEIRHQGLGQFLGRVLDTQAIEQFALSGGLTALVALIQVLIAATVLSAGIGGLAHTLILLAWVLLTLALGWHYWRTSRGWVVAYRGMTNDLVERMVGHRTRLAQQDPATWHADEDRDLDRYLDLSARVDRAGMWLAAIPRAWMIVGLGWIGVALVTSGYTLTLLAIALGGVLLALQALTSIIAGIQSVVGVTQAWSQVAPLFDAATRHEQVASLVLPAQPATGSVQPPLLTAQKISFRYREFGVPVLDRCSLQINHGDRLLLQGPSGGGKSSLAAVLAGLRAPESGLLLLRGYDRASVGAEAWRRRVAVAPQFHENHVFTETFAFNLLLGRRWPPTEQDLQEAEAICQELGLGDLIKRMPSGLQQMLGESGWRLSHGERSRLYIARALLQPADLMILDESFAALDPETLELALRCVLRRAPTLMVIAHP